MHTYTSLVTTFASVTGVSYMMRWNARSKMRSGEELTGGDKASIWLSDGLRGGNDIAMHEHMLEIQKENEALRAKVDKADSDDEPANTSADAPESDSPKPS